MQLFLKDVQFSATCGAEKIAFNCGEFKFDGEPYELADALGSMGEAMVEGAGAGTEVAQEPEKVNEPEPVVVAGATATAA